MEFSAPVFIDSIESFEALGFVELPNSGVADPLVLGFLTALSRQLLSCDVCRPYSDVVALGYWLRKANLDNIIAMADLQSRRPLGLVVHYSPQNVDTMFVYSWVCSLLMGNRNIVRLGSKQADVQLIVLRQIQYLLQQSDFSQLARRNVFLHFPKHSAAAKHISMLADARVIWGGDETVNTVRALPCKPRTRDICFPDRHSIAVINGCSLSTDNLLDVAERLWRDIYSFNQQGCASPKAIFWIGSDDYLEQFFATLGHLSDNRDFADTFANEQLVFSQYMIATAQAEAIMQHAKICVLEMNDDASLDVDWHPGHLLLMLYKCGELNDVGRYLTSTTQTLSHFGVGQAELACFTRSDNFLGVDRIVPMGQALRFDLKWDGYNLLEQLSKILVLEMV